MSKSRSAFKSNENPWQDFAGCLGADPEIFFPKRGSSTKEARAICAGCLVCDNCLDLSFELGLPEGVWGGENQKSRAELLRRRELIKPVLTGRIPIALGPYLPMVMLEDASQLTSPGSELAVLCSSTEGVVIGTGKLSLVDVA